MEPGKARVHRVVEEARRSVVRDFPSVRPGRATVQCQVRYSSSVSVTSRAPVRRVGSEFPYHVYDAVGREFNFLRGQVAGIRESMDAFSYATARRSTVSASEV